jgi:alanine racemase
MGMTGMLPNRSWAEVDLDRIGHNARRVRALTRKTAEVMGVVKADAYGHGVSRVVPVLLENGVTRLAVSMLDEALELRRQGVAVPILVLGYTDPRRADEIISGNVTQTVYSRDLARSLSDAACRMGREARIHIKIDTGMGRVGFLAGFEAVRDTTWIHGLPAIVIEGAYTHFASADEEDPAYTIRQHALFTGVCSELDACGVTIPIKHVCNSAAILRFPAMHMDMVRAGLILYGMLPSPFCGGDHGLLPAMTLKSNVVLCKAVEAGSPISYGRTYVTPGPTRIATIPIGYADGYPRSLAGKASVLVGGRRAPLAGRICMDMCMADVGGLPCTVSVGDEVVLFGRQGEGEIPVEEIGEWMGTINYEVTCLIGRRVPRAYLTCGQVEAVSNYLL